MKFAILALSLLLLVPVHAQENILRNGDFTQVNEHNQPAAWDVSHPTHLEKHHTVAEVRDVQEDGVALKVYTITKNSDTKAISLGSQVVILPANAAAVRIQARMRGTAIFPGSDWWHFPGVSIAYLFPGGVSKMGDMQKWILLPKGDSEWKVYETVIPVRDNAPQASIGIISHGWAGTLEVDWIRAEILQNP